MVHPHAVAPVAPAPVAAPPPPAPPVDERAAQMNALTGLLNAGVLTHDEFVQISARLHHG